MTEFKRTINKRWAAYDFNELALGAAYWTLTLDPVHEPQEGLVAQ